MYVIAGASGNTGRVAAEELLARRREVRVLGRDAERLLSLVGKGAEAFAVDLQDTGKLTQALAGAKAAYLLIPSYLGAPDFAAYQRKVAESLARAVGNSGIRYVVLLSSIGAQHETGTGAIEGLHYAEERLKQIHNLNLLIVRAAFFMENFYMTIPAIHQYGFLGTAVAPNVRIPMISTGDIGRYVAERLDKLDFKGKEVRELLGHQDLTMTEAASIIGEALGKPDLKYRQLDEATMRQALTAAGVSASTVDSYLEMARAMSDGTVTRTEARTPANTTPTSLEVFAVHHLSQMQPTA
jgi:uncharacterized protein YbjT (DUF2867 family)